MATAVTITETSLIDKLGAHGPCAVRCKGDCFNLCLTRQSEKLQWNYRWNTALAVQNTDPVAPLKRLCLQPEDIMADEGEKVSWKPGPPMRVFVAGWSTIEEFDRIVESLNASRITRILVNPSPRVIGTLFQKLAVPALRVLDLTGLCHPTEEVVPSLIDYLQSPRSHGLEYLILPNGDRPRLAERIDLTNALRTSNTTLRTVCDRSCGFEEYPPIHCDCAERVIVYPFGSCQRRQQAFNQVLKRNATLTRRVRQAALRILTVARVLLYAQPASVNVSEGLTVNKRSPRTTISDLPCEVLLDIANFAGEDDAALTEAQTLHIDSAAQDRKSISEMARFMTEADAMDGARGVRNTRDEWLANGGFWWDRFPPSSP